MANIPVEYIEDCLEYIAGIRGNIGFNPQPEDAGLLRSLGVQVSKGTALTDRQYALANKVLAKYCQAFEDAGVEDCEGAMQRHRMPLRDIDRSRYVRIVSTEEIDSANFRSDRCIKVRFPFNKKTIAQLYELTKDLDEKHYYHKKGSHAHYFTLDEYHTLKVIDLFGEKDFEIAVELRDYYDAVKRVSQSPEQHLPGIHNGELVNVSEQLRNTTMEDTQGDLVKIVDRRRRYGLENINHAPDLDTLAKKIAFRDSQFFSGDQPIDTRRYLEALYELDRFPLLVTVEGTKEEDQIFEIYSVLKNFIPTEAQSVLFRQEGNTNLNKFIAEKQLNNWVDENTQVVYIRHNKFPKILLNSGWQPVAAYSEMCYTFNYYNPVNIYIKEHCDLIVHKEKCLMSGWYTRDLI